MSRAEERQMALSKNLQAVARQVERLLIEAAGPGEKPAFVLMAVIDKNTQYVSNVERADGVELIEELLARWKLRAPDVPHHEKN